jgi:beta-N-acetylhexosaminidase
MPRAFVTGVSGPLLSDAERRFLSEADPFGLILFRRNVEGSDQIRRLTDDFRDCVGRDAPVMVDQEGGRVQRLTAPVWRKYPSASRIARAAAVSADEALIADVARVMAADLREVGITVDCMPCLDLGMPGQSDVIGDRAYDGDPAVVARAGRAVAAGLLAGGVLPVIKHIPGHGRATVDSHHALPVVTAGIDDLTALDFAPFVALSDLPAAMTAHLVFTDIDPDWPATQSPIVISQIIRGLIGFDGLLFSDDLSMNALIGPIGERAGRCLAAGCDVALHCNGVLAEMEEVASVAPRLSGDGLRRADAALSRIGPPDRLDVEPVLARLDAALAAFDVATGI